MNEDQTAKELSALFGEAGHAHHQAFLSVNGADDEWPLWYAEYLHPKLEALLDRQFTRSELVYLLVKADREHKATASDQDWRRFYVRYFI